MSAEAPETVHASCVAWGDRGLLILGRPGAGKSRLALELMALGCALVADDRVALRRAGTALRASAPPALAGLVEARGVGVLRVRFRREAAVRLVVDLDRPPAGRMPPPLTARLLGMTIPLLCAREGPGPAALLAALRHGPAIEPPAGAEAVDGDRERPGA
jgi:HPr kinase/phosphorylase